MRRTKEEKAKNRSEAKHIEATHRALSKQKQKEVRAKKSDYQELAEEIMHPTSERKAQAKAEFLKLPKAKRLKIRRKFEDSGEGFTFLAWWKSKQANDPGSRQQEGRARRKGKNDATLTLTISHDKKKLDKHIRKAMAIPTTPKRPFIVLLQPMVIVPDDPKGKVIVADAGTIVKLADMTTLYRERMSPITHRADEILVQYGNAKKQELGWLAGKFPSWLDEAMKPSRGPTFLVKTSGEDTLNGWERLRLKVARTRAKDPSNWIAPWLAHHGPKHPRELREVTRLFGGKPIKNEEVETRIERLFSLILHTELDMATAKSKKSKIKKGKQKRNERDNEAKTTKTKKAKGKFSEKSDLITKKYNDYVIKRLIKENPFREGSNRAKLWNKLKKGMTVIEFNAFGEGRARTELRHYRASGWIKLRKPAA